MLWQDLYVYMTHALAATERIVVGSGVTNPLTRHPSVTASAHATLADLHPGRVVLGIGRGDNAVRTLGLKPVPTAELAETVPRLRAWMAGEEAAGTRIRWADERVPIMLCATGPKNLRLAGALADIAMIYVGVHPASVRWAIDHVRAGAEEAGRDPDEVEIAALCAMHVSDDQEEAWEECRWAPAACANHIAYALKWNPRARHAGGDDPARRRARGVRLLRRPPRLVGGAHELPDRRARRRLRRSPGRWSGAWRRSESWASWGSTRSRPRT